MRLTKLFAVLLSTFMLTAISHAGKVALDGYCPVCYIAVGKAAKGDKQYAADHNGKTYHFVNEDVKNTFLAAPDKYLPQYDGYCAYGVAKGKKKDVDPTVFTVVDGKLYLNFNKQVGEKFNKDTKGFIAEANKKWPSLK